MICISVFIRSSASSSYIFIFIVGFNLILSCITHTYIIYSVKTTSATTTSKGWHVRGWGVVKHYIIIPSNRDVSINSSSTSHRLNSWYCCYQHSQFYNKLIFLHLNKSFHSLVLSVICLVWWFGQSAIFPLQQFKRFF